MELRQEGFEESDDERLHSKLNEHTSKDEQPDTFYAIPEAKPLLDKNLIDINKPKVLIKQIPMFLEPVQLLSSSLHNHVPGCDRPHNSKPICTQDSPLTTIWDKYILSDVYFILYLKYYKEDPAELQSRGIKRYKLELQKMCRNQSYLFSTYLIDLGFLGDAGSSLMRNLKPLNLHDHSSMLKSQGVTFDSRFECGNLFAVFQKKLNSERGSKLSEYDLILQSDINTKGYSNWFYFAVKCREKTVLKFNIVNMQKTHSLYNEGMKVAVFSMSRHQQQKLEWHRDGFGYAYYKNQLRKSNQNEATYNTLTFFYEVRYEDDLVYFAANVPYSYTKLLKHIDSLEKIARLNSSLYFRRDNIASTISNNICPMLTLTWKRDKKKGEKRPRKKIIGVLARQHPCESVSSYVMEGFLNSLVYVSSESAVHLLQNYIFKIIPMVNVDGVIYGNSRCDISGTDINRKWTKSPNRTLYPVVAAIRSLFTQLVKDEYEIDYFIDLHGHSRNMGAFVYACKTYDEVESRQLAWIMSRLNSKFLFEESLFGLSHKMKDTARGSMCDLVTKKRALTVETSFYGYRSISSKHFEIKDLEKLGATLVESLYADFSRDSRIFNWSTIQSQIKQSVDNIRSRKKIVKQEEDSSSFASDSDPEEDQMTMKQKCQHFFDSIAASKIGLNEIKVIQKTTAKVDQKQGQLHILKLDALLNRIDDRAQSLEPADQCSPTIKPFGSQNLKQALERGKSFVIRQSKSTKSIPFKFTQRPQRVSSLPRKGGRKSIQLLVPRPQKLDAQQMPRSTSLKGTDFWSSLKRQYESLLIQRKLNTDRAKLKG